jgi:hypothetical protein
VRTTAVAADLTRVLHGPYTPPPLRRGDHAVCLFRDSEVVITSWSNARIPWPRCRRAGHRAGPGLRVNEELARAIRLESSRSLQHWFGVSEFTVWKWRKALGVERFNEGSARLHTEGRCARSSPPGGCFRKRATWLDHPACDA